MVLTNLRWSIPVFVFKNQYIYCLFSHSIKFLLPWEYSQIVQQNSMWWSAAHLNFGRVCHHFQMMAPSHVKRGHCDHKGLLFPLAIGCVADAETFRAGGDQGRGGSQGGDNCGLR